MGKAARVAAAMRAAQERMEQPPKPKTAVATATMPSVAIGYVHGNQNMSTSFVHSRDALLHFDRCNAGLVRGFLPLRHGTEALPQARNDIAAGLLATDHDWLLMVDCDAGFEPDALYRLLEVAHPEKRPIVGALAFTQREISEDGMCGHRTVPTPTIFDWRTDPDTGKTGHMVVMTYPVNMPVQCAATGCHFILIHRSAFERIAETVVPGTSEKIGPTWFDRAHNPQGGLMGEDVSFCVKAALAGIPVFVHTGVRTSHFKNRWLSEVDHWQSYKPGPATEEVAVIVPVLRRPQNAEPFMRSLRASTGLAHVYAVADDDDPETIAAWEKAGATVIVDSVRTFARKVNLGYAKTSEPWLFITGDDVKFHPGWLDHAQHVAEALDGKVIGTNDWGNPRVTRGEHAVHMLIRRSYVDEVGASFDGPGVVAHEGFRHWGVDDVIVTAAKLRGVWQMALGSIVEHRHPYWREDVPKDDTYALGEAAAEEDMALLRRILAEHGVAR